MGEDQIQANATALGRCLRCLLLIVAILGWPGAATAAAGCRPAALDRLVSNGGLVLTRDGAIICSRNPDQLLIPASTWKLGTALAAFHVLGPEYRFETRFFQSPDHTLYIQGLGDPMLVSEEVAEVMAEFARAGVREIDDIVLDDSTFALAHPADGAGVSLNPYDAANGALAVNFNTVNIVVAADHTVRSAEPQTPTLPLMTELGRGLHPGEHRINIGDDHARVLRHVGELFRAIQQRQGIAGTGRIRAGRVPAGLAPLLCHRSSKRLPELVTAMLLYSNNFIANQLFLAMGAKRAGYPATWAKGRTALGHFLHDELGLAPQTVEVEEGSGLSRRNRITPRGLLAILNAFAPHSTLLPLKNSRRVKSGTLTGVYAYAGYLNGDKGPDGFVLILNQAANTRDRLLDLLAALHDRSGAGS